jgi:deazaflavin-dependent oxidoreductase (nitroreductase family)
MAYIRPPWFVQKVFNPLAMMTGMSGAATLAIRGRTSGAVRKVPVIPVEVDGAKYIVSTRGESEWVRNLRAAGEAELTRKGQTERVRATEVPAAERGPIIEAYRKVAGKTVEPYWKSLPDAADHPVFRVEHVS